VKGVLFNQMGDVFVFDTLKLDFTENGQVI